MTGLRMMLKTIGVEIKDEHLRAVEVIIPQVPERAQRIVTAVNQALFTANERITAIETRMIALETEIKTLNDSIRELIVRADAGFGGTKRTGVNAGANGSAGRQRGITDGRG